MASWKTTNAKDPVFKTKSQTYKAEAIELDSNGPFQNIQACQLFGNLTMAYLTRSTHETGRKSKGNNLLFPFKTTVRSKTERVEVG